jgi:hypothetical protein
VILAFLLAAAAPATAVDAERAFAAMAQTEGQWAAFRAFAASEGLLFVPEQVNAQEWLKEAGASPDGSLVWNRKVYDNGARIVWGELWDGARHRKVIEDKVV